MRSAMVRVTSLLVVLVAIAFATTDLALANGSVREIEYSTSLSEATGIVRIIVAVFGGLIGLLGIVVAFKGVGRAADVSATIGKHASVSMKRVGQGVVLTVIGAAVLIGALYFLPDKKTERELAGKEITVEREGGKVKEVMKK